MNLMHKLQEEEEEKNMKMEIGSYQRTMSKFSHLPLCTEDEKINVYFRVTGDVN